VQTILPLSNTAGLKLTTARYYTPSGRSIQAKGIEPDVYVDDGRDVSNRIREANLERHLETNKPGATKGAASPAAPAQPGPAATPPKDDRKDDPPDAQPMPPRFEFGAADDFQLAQAMNHLKGQPVIASIKSVAAANAAAPAAGKP
jgi:carboxyl-terminal processing protease